MSLSPILRTVAIAIALAGIVDPVATLSRPARQPLVIAVLDPAPDSAYEAAGRLRSRLSDVYDVVVRHQSASTDASPCPDDGACVVISDGVAPRRLRASGTLGGVRVPRSQAPSVAIKSVHAPASVDPDARGVITLDLETKEASPLVRVFDGSVIVGQSTTRRIEWTPVARGLRQLRIATVDDEAHVGVEVAPQRHPVMFFEARPTWMGTFVRRALEADPRFAVRSRARLAQAVSVSTGNVSLDLATLDREDPRVVVVSAVDQLTTNEVATLNAFMTRRGGSVVALVDAAPSGPSRALLPFTFGERREAQPVAIAELKGSEVITMTPRDAVTTSLASIGGTSVIVSRPVGNGRLVASGASDAWRFREDAGFNAYWQSLVADAADAAGDALAVSLETQLARPHEHVRVNVEWRALREVASTIDARATLSCGSTLRPIRLWPDGAPGRFVGEFVSPAAGDCRVSATVNTVTGSRALLVRDVRTARRAATDLATAIVAHGGTVVNAGNEEALVTVVSRSTSSRDISTQIHPMRSPLWIVPFAACLGGEWWLRRRPGLTPQRT